MTIIRIYDKHNYWLSWWRRLGIGLPLFDLYWPWWVTDKSNPDLDIICAAVQARTMDEAKQIIIDAHRGPIDIKVWRIQEEKPVNWSPFSARLIRADHMVWKPLTGEVL